MRFALEIDCDNAAFEESPGDEIARILREAAAALEAGAYPGGVLRDANGNRVGRYDLEEKRK